MADSLTIRHEREPFPDITTPDPHQDHFSKVHLGFWMYLMTDCILFASLFITHAVLQHNTFEGPTAKDLFSLRTAFAETMILLFSSLTCGFAILAGKASKGKQAIGWLAVTFLLGLSFLILEIEEFRHFVREGASWQRSAFLSSFFTLVGTHGAHITAGLIWCLTMIGQIAFQGIAVDTFRRLALFNLFWHFLDLIWIFIFTLVYLAGVI